MAIALSVAVAAIVVHAKRQQAQRAIAHDALASHEAKLRAVFDSLTEGLVFLDVQGQVMEINEAAQRYGHTVAELRDSRRDPRFRLVRSDGSQFPVDEQPAMVALRTGQPVNDVEMGVPRADGSMAWRVVNAHPVVDDRRQLLGAVASFFDITDRKRIEAELRESEQRFRALVTATSYIVYRMSPDWSEMRQLDGRGFIADTPAASRSWLREYIDPGDQPAVTEAIQRAILTRQMFELEHRVRRVDGTLGWVLSRAVPLLDEHGEVVEWFGAASDVTDRRNAQDALRRSHEELERRVEARTAELHQRADQLRRLASDLTLTEQRTREAVSRTLHDGVQQLVFGAKLQLSRLARGAVRDAAVVPEVVDRVSAALDEAIAATRTLSLDLSPPVLREAGLVAALEWLAAQVREKQGLEVELSLDPDADPESADVSVLVFESVRELLFNVVKHSAVRRATVELATEGADRFRVTVADNGRGLDAGELRSPPASASGLGLFTIGERLALLGGRLQIVSTPGNGARFILVAPRYAAACHAATPGR